MTKKFEPSSGPGDERSDASTNQPAQAPEATEALRQVFQESKTSLWIVGLVILGMFERAAIFGSGRIDQILSACLAVGVWAGIGWILMAPFTAIRRQGIPTLKQVLLATTILGIISVFGGELGLIYGRLVSS